MNCRQTAYLRRMAETNGSAPSARRFRLDPSQNIAWPQYSPWARVPFNLYSGSGVRMISRGTRKHTGPYCGMCGAGIPARGKTASW